MDLHGVRRLVEETLLQKNSIDRLFRDQVEDFIIIKEQPMPIKIGAKTIFIGNFTLETEQKFFQKWAQIINLMVGRICNWRLMDERKKELNDKCSFFMLADGKTMNEFLMRDKWFCRQLMDVINETVLKQQAYYLNNAQERELISWKNCDWKYFKKNVSSMDLIQICYYIYLYNFDSVKKNAILLLDRMGMKALTETSIPGWLANMPGLTGRFLQSQAPNIDWSSNVKPNDSMLNQMREAREKETSNG